MTISPVVVGTHVWRNTCTGSGTNNTSQATFTHTVHAPVVATISQSLSVTTAGSPYTLTWGSTAAVTCALDGSRNGEVPIVYSTALSGSMTISPVVVGTHVWRNICTGAGGDTSLATFTHTVQ
jgi:hypothetical protein